MDTSSKQQRTYEESEREIVGREMEKAKIVVQESVGGKGVIWKVPLESVIVESTLSG